MNLQNILIITVLTTLVACQPANNNGNNNTPIPAPTATDGAAAQVDTGRIGPDEGTPNINHGSDFMANPEQLFVGGWRSDCYSSTEYLHIPFVPTLQWYRMYYYFQPNHVVAHTVREFNRPGCVENFNGAINPYVRDAVIITGIYTPQDDSATRPNAINVAFQWTTCVGACSRPENPIDGIYKFHIRVAGFLPSEDGRQMLFWGSNVLPRPGSRTPLLAEQEFNWAVPFLRIRENFNPSDHN